METPGLLVVARIHEVIVPECVVECMSGTSVSKGEHGAGVMACVSACMKIDDGLIQMEDGDSEPNRP